MKKDAIQSSNESIQLYEDEQKSLQEKLQKLNEKQQDLAMK
jgi:ribosome recycling factor